MRRVLLLGLAALILVQPPAARADEPRTALSAVFGRGTTYDDESSLGSGWVVGGGADRVLFGTTRAEFWIEAIGHTRQGGYFESRGTSIVAGAALVHRFGRRKAQPYMLGGLTVNHHNGTNDFGDITTHPRSTNSGFRAGAGVAIRAGARVEVRPEFRWDTFFIDTDADPATLPSIAVRLALRL
jgi:opacity protein-like surface antigen